MFERLSVLAGSFDAAGAEAIVSGDGVDAPEVVDALTGLAAKSMIVVQASARTTRYELLETLREYGRVRLDEHDDGDRWRRHTLEHYVAFADDYHTLLWGPDEDRWAQRLSDEGDNIRECVTWAIGHSDQEAELALQIVGRLARRFNQAFGQGLGVVIEQAAELASRVDPGLGSTVLAAAAWSAIHRGDADRARRYAEAAVADPRIAVQGPVPEIAFSAISMVEATAGNPEKALRQRARGRSRARSARGERRGDPVHQDGGRGVGVRGGAARRRPGRGGGIARDGAPHRVTRPDRRVALRPGPRPGVRGRASCARRTRGERRAPPVWFGLHGAPARALAGGDRASPVAGR